MHPQLLTEHQDRPTNGEEMDDCEDNSTNASKDPNSRIDASVATNHTTITTATTTTTTTTCPFAIPLLTKQQQPQQHPHSPLLSPSSTESSPSFSYTTVPTWNQPTITAAQALQLAKETCPAFQSSCPFRNVQDEKSMRAALQSLPPSHLCFRSPNATVGDDKDDDDDEKIFNKDKNQEEIGNNSLNIVRENNDIGELVKVALAHVHNVSRHLDSKVVVGSTATATATATATLDTMKKSANDDAVKNQNPSPGMTPPPPFQKIYGKSASFSDEMERFSLFGLMGKLIQEELGIQPQPEEHSSENLDSIRDNVVASTPPPSSKNIDIDDTGSSLLPVEQNTIITH